VTALGCLFAPAAFGLDPPEFTVDPDPPIAGDLATFTPSPEVPVGATVTWDYEADDTFVPDNTHTFAEAGSYPVTMRVDDGGVVTDYPKTVTVRPVAAFHRDPVGVPVTGQVVRFTSDSVPWSGQTISSLRWDVDGDGFDDGTGPVLNYAFATSGDKVVRLEVVQSNDERDVAESFFRVNAPPRAGFVWTPASPVAGGAVQLYSTSVDAEGALTSEAWDLDGDGAFDDAFGPSVAHTFSAGGYDVSLRVTDGDGVARTITRRITVAAPILPAAPPLMSPFPTVRLVGVVLSKGARITLVEVRGAPRGARVTVRCTGRGCPFSVRRRVAVTGRVRLTNFTRVLRARARIEVFVRAPKVIGRYVSWRIRAGKRPVRTDRCLLPGASEPTRCT
jgi:PKD repeat protein